MTHGHGLLEILNKKYLSCDRLLYVLYETLNYYTLENKIRK